MASRNRTNSYERKPFAAENVEIRNPEARVDVAAVARGADPLAGMEIDPEARLNPDQLSVEQFMAQEMEIHLMDPGSEDENQFVEVTVNGDYRIGRRGESMLLRRYHVAVLAVAKEMRLKQTKVTNPDGSMGYEERMVSRLTYPFSVIHDPAGRRGSDWLRGQLQAAR